MAGQDRWERAVLSGQSAIATALICIVVLVTLPLLKMLVRLGALVGLASLYINNPCREPSTHNKAWEMLLAERRRRIGERNAKDVSNLNHLIAHQERRKRHHGPDIRPAGNVRLRVLLLRVHRQRVGG